MFSTTSKETEKIINMSTFVKDSLSICKFPETHTTRDARAGYAML